MVDTSEVFESISPEYREFLASRGLGQASQFTCGDCDQVTECDFAFDAYNTDGECLAMK